MATYLANLTARRDAVAAEIAAIDTDAAGGVPDSGASGVEHDKYKAGLYAELEKLKGLIDDATADEEGPIEVLSRGHST